MNSMQNTGQHNSLNKASSPYLKQHAHNPVDWYEWGKEALDKAKAENKPLLISIGYSACHWCHVMAHEVFENEASAALMNAYFVNIKIDREERPDIDQIYMDAAQMLTGRGGWPLNIFALPDGRPFHGGTYFPKKDWDIIVSQIADLYQTKPETVFEFARNLSTGIKDTYRFNFKKTAWGENDFHYAVQHLKNTRDLKNGGFNRAPKFPLPVVYQFALHYVHLYHDPELLEWVDHSLKRMCTGGLYDTVGGGFARYSVDAQWHAPHFEKMLYDNGQMLALLANTFMLTNDAFYLKKMEETHDFFLREWQQADGGLYSALDADSEGVEGKYYTYLWGELDGLSLDLKNFEDVLRYFNISKEGNWEHGQNILFATSTPKDFAQQEHLNAGNFENQIKRFLEALNSLRKDRFKPGLDDKILTSWNALAATGLLTCYQATGEKKYLESAESILAFIEQKLHHQGELYRNYIDGKAVIPAFLEDFVMLAEALTLAYQLTFKEEYLLKAKAILEKLVLEFKEEGELYFVFNPDPQQELFVKKIDLGDDVIPSANSVLCELLVKHGFYFENTEWLNLAQDMLENLREQVLKGPAWYCRWLSAALLVQNGLNQLTLVDRESPVFQGRYLPNSILVKPSSNISLSTAKLSAESGYYLCRQFECYAPELDLEKVLERMY